MTPFDAFAWLLAVYLALFVFAFGIVFGWALVDWITTILRDCDAFRRMAALIVKDREVAELERMWDAS